MAFVLELDNIWCKTNKQPNSNSNCVICRRYPSRHKSIRCESLYSGHKAIVYFDPNDGVKPITAWIRRLDRASLSANQALPVLVWSHRLRLRHVRLVDDACHCCQLHCCKWFNTWRHLLATNDKQLNHRYRLGSKLIDFDWFTLETTTHLITSRLV